MSSKKIIYITDPLCLWCYGAADIVEDFYQELPKDLHKEVINGGLFPASQAKACDGEFINYIQMVAKRVTEMSGKQFSPDFWKLISQSNFSYDTEPSARAVVVVKHLYGVKEAMSYAHAIQHAFFVEGRNVMLSSVLADIAADESYSRQSFLAFYMSDESLDLTKQEYSESKQLGVRGFPAHIYINKNMGYSLSSGFTDKSSLHKALSWAEQQCEPKKEDDAPLCTTSGCSK